MKKACSFIIKVTALVFLPFVCFADIAVVVHPDNPINQISADDLTRIYLGKIDSFPNGAKALPIDLKEGDTTRTSFYQKVANKSQAQLNSYWARLIFTGKGTPPHTVRNTKKVKSLVSSDKNYVGYMDASEVDGSVKVIFTVN